MVSILRKSITDLSAFERQRKKRSTKTQPSTQPTDSASKSATNPWVDDGSSKTPPPLDALHNNASGKSKRTCFNCEREGCLIGRCPEPLNLKRIAANLEKFKKAKADRSNNSNWKTKRINLTELQPSPEEWIDVYEVIVTESLLIEHSALPDTFNTCVDANATNTSKAFSCFDGTTNDANLTHAFQISVGNGNPDGDEETSASNFTSLFDLMTKAPSMNLDNDEHF